MYRYQWVYGQQDQDNKHMKQRPRQIEIPRELQSTQPALNLNDKVATDLDAATRDVFSQLGPKANAQPTPNTTLPTAQPDSITIPTLRLATTQPQQPSLSPEEQNKQPTQVQMNRFLERNALYQKHSTLKKNQQRREHLQQDTSKCTFTPKIIPSPILASPPQPTHQQNIPVETTYRQLYERKNSSGGMVSQNHSRQRGKTYSQLVKESVKVNKKYRKMHPQEKEKIVRYAAKDTDRSQLKEIYKDILSWPGDEQNSRNSQELSPNKQDKDNSKIPEKEAEDEAQQQGKTTLRALINALNNYESKAYIKEEDRPIRQIIEEVIRSTSHSPQSKSPPAKQPKQQLKRQPSWREREAEAKQATAANMDTPQQRIALRRTLSITQQIPEAEMEKTTPVRGGMSFNSTPSIPPTPTPIEQPVVAKPTEKVVIQEEEQPSGQNFFDQILEEADERHRQTISGASIAMHIPEIDSPKKPKVTQSQLVISHEQESPLASRISQPSGTPFLKPSPSSPPRQLSNNPANSISNSNGNSRISVESGGTNQNRASKESKRWDKWSVVLSQRNSFQQKSSTNTSNNNAYRSSIQPTLHRGSSGKGVTQSSRMSLPGGTGHTQHQDWLNRLKEAAQESNSKISEEKKKVEESEVKMQEEKEVEEEKVTEKESSSLSQKKPSQGSLKSQKSKKSLKSQKSLLSQKSKNSLKSLKSHSQKSKESLAKQSQAEVPKAQQEKKEHHQQLDIPSSPIEELVEEPPILTDLVLEMEPAKEELVGVKKQSEEPLEYPQLPDVSQLTKNEQPRLQTQESTEEFKVVWVRDSEQEPEAPLSEAIEQGLDLQIKAEQGVGQEYPMRLNYSMLTRPWMKSAEPVSPSKKTNLIPEVIMEEQEEESKDSH